MLKVLGGFCLHILFNIHIEKYLGCMIKGNEIT